MSKAVFYGYKSGNDVGRAPRESRNRRAASDAASPLSARDRRRLAVAGLRDADTRRRRPLSLARVVLLKSPERK
jgi:hypothetical protein